MSTMHTVNAAQSIDRILGFLPAERHRQIRQRVAAEKWVKQLKPSVGKAVVIPGARDGETFYRVRIIGLADRAQAETVAGQLHSTYKLPPLWVGRE